MNTMVRKNNNSREVPGLRDKLSETGQNILEIGHLARRAANTKLHELRDAAASQVGKGKEKLSSLEERLESGIQSKPIKGVLIAAAVGLVMGLMLRRR